MYKLACTSHILSKCNESIIIIGPCRIAGVNKGREKADQENTNCLHPRNKPSESIFTQGVRIKGGLLTLMTVINIYLVKWILI